MPPKYDDSGRVCSVCGEYKLWREFSDKKAKRYKDKIDAKYHQLKQPKCKACAKVETTTWRFNQSPERLKHLYLTNTYGLSYTEFLNILEEQNNTCKICGKPIDADIEARLLKSDSAVVDHCHISGKVRGILCNECNRGLGYFHDNKQALLRAAAYLAEAEEK